MNDIDVYRNTLSKKDCENLIELLKQKTLPPRGEAATLLDISDPVIIEWAKQFGLSIIERYLKKYKSESIDSYQIYKVQHIYYNPGTSCPVHSDCEYSDGYVRNIVLVLYLNDDLNGGELYFPTKNFAVQPEAGTCVLFPAGFSYPHGVHKCSVERHGLSFVVHKIKENKKDFYE